MENEKKKIPFKYIIPALPPVLFLISFGLIKRNRSAVLAYVSGFSYPVRMALGRISEHIPFSVMELFYTVLIVWALWYVIRTVYLLCRRDRSVSVLLKRLFVLVLTALYLISLYSALFGVDYYGLSFSERSGLYPAGVTVEDLTAVTEYFARLASEYSTLVRRDANGSVCEDMDAIFEYAGSSYDGAISEFPCLGGEIFTPKKMFYSVIMSYMGFTGVYFPFTGESNVNVHSPIAFIPSTITHEIAHQKGITNESECNFIGILTAVTCNSTIYRYSGYISGLIYLMNALARVDVDAWREIRGSFSPELDHDWKENSEYWDLMEINLTHITETVYDTYLKTYGQSLGMASYGACVDLLVTYYSDAARA